MSLEEFEDNTDPKTKRYLTMKSIMDLGMGVIYIGVGILILMAKRIGLSNEFVEGTPPCAVLAKPSFATDELLCV